MGRYSRAALALVFVPLYAGPFLAGLSRHPLATIPVFALVFLFFIAATRKPDLTDPAGLAAFGIMGLVQLVIVSAVFGVGAAAALVSPPVALPVWLPLVLSAVAAVLGSLRYSDQAEMDVFVDGAIAQIEALDHPAALDLDTLHWAPTPEIQAALDRAEAALRALPEDARVAHIDPIVQTLESEADAGAFDPFYDLVTDDLTDDRRLALGLLRFVASPYIRRQLVQWGEGGLAAIPFLNHSDAGLRGAARGLVLDLLDDGAPADQLPEAAFLTQLDRDFPGEGFDDLAALCARATAKSA